jgi:hypothetical protein
MTDHQEQYPPHAGPDTGGAFRGLILGAVILFAILVTIVKVTNAYYNRHPPEPPAPSTTTK